MQELHSDNEEELYQDLKGLLTLPTVDILDESDELLSHSFQLVYAWGQECPLPSRHQRVLLIQHVLQVLGKDPAIREVISGTAGNSFETDAVSFTLHPDRPGSLPAVRLLPGERLSALSWLLNYEVGKVSDRCHGTTTPAKTMVRSRSSISTIS